MFGSPRQSLAASPASFRFPLSPLPTKHKAPPVGCQPIMPVHNVKGKMRAGLGRLADEQPQRMRRSTVIEPRSGLAHCRDVRILSSGATQSVCVTA